MESVLNHSFAGKVAAACRVPLKAILASRPKDADKFAEWQASNRARMSASGRYAFDVLEAYGALSRVILRSEHASQLVRVSPSRLRGRAGRVPRDEWSDLLLASHAAALTATLDTSLLLTNEVYQLGLAPQHCRFEVLESHSSLRRSRTRTSLKALRTTLADLTARRNRYLHRGTEADAAELVELDFAMEFKGLSLLSRGGADPEVKAILKYGWRRIVKQITVRLTEIADGVESDLSNVLSGLETVFEARHSALLEWDVRENGVAKA